MSEREEFEKWARPRALEMGDDLQRYRASGEYRWARMEEWWDVWQAATLAERERAARVAHDFYDDNPYTTVPLGERIAAAIREGK